MIRKGPLHRICRRCGKTYKPSGRWVKICDKCNKQKGKKDWLDKLYKDMLKDSKLKDN